MPHRSTLTQSLRRSWWLPVLLAALGALIAAGAGVFDTTDSDRATATIHLNGTDGVETAAATGILSSEVRTSTSEALAAEGVDITASELLGRTTVDIDDTDLVRVEVEAGIDSKIIATTLAQTFLEARAESVAAAREERAEYLARLSSTLTRDLLTAGLTISDAEADQRLAARLDARVLALEVERDQLILGSLPTDDVERQLAVVRAELVNRTPAVSVVDLTRARSSQQLLSSQLEGIRDELVALAAPLGSVGTLDDVRSTVRTEGGGINFSSVLLFAMVGAGAGLLAAGLLHVVTSVGVGAVDQPGPAVQSRAVEPPAPPLPTESDTILPGAPSQSPQPPQPPRAAPRPSPDRRVLSTDPASATIVPRPPQAPEVVVPTDRSTEPRQLPAVLVSIPAPGPDEVHPLTVNHPTGAAGRAYTELMSTLLASAESTATPTISMIGPGHGTGRTTVAVNVAAAASAAGHRVLLVTPLWEEIDIPGLPVLPPGLGLTEPTTFPAVADFRAALDDVASLIDVVIVDTYPSDTHPEMIALAAETDLSAVVVMTGRTNVNAVAELSAELDAHGAQVAGVVVNAHQAEVGV